MFYRRSIAYQTLVRDEFEASCESEINHADPNLDTLAEKELVEKGQKDMRPNASHCTHMLCSHNHVEALCGTHGQDNGDYRFQKTMFFFRPRTYDGL